MAKQTRMANSHHMGKQHNKRAHTVKRRLKRVHTVKQHNMAKIRNMAKWLKLVNKHNTVNLTLTAKHPSMARQVLMDKHQDQQQHPNILLVKRIIMDKVSMAKRHLNTIVKLVLIPQASMPKQQRQALMDKQQRRALTGNQQRQPPMDKQQQQALMDNQQRQPPMDKQQRQVRLARSPVRSLYFHLFYKFYKIKKKDGF
mmetsp:Transcript_4989/g.6496  ORF Transcript_4989/g.6496 Transcript_4989/m.6496 type:complete len:199 (-) Transcript_4989:508-1104(-)